MVVDLGKIMTAYRCAACGNTVFGMTGALSLTGDLINLKCECQKSRMEIKKIDDGKLRITVPCAFCQNDHTFVISRKLLLSRELFTYPCPYVGVDICFFGNENSVKEAVEESDKALSEMISEEEMAALERENQKPSQGDEYMRSLIKFIMGQLLEDGHIDCGCESGEFLIEDIDDTVKISCKKCGYKKIFYCDNSLETQALLDADRISLSK